MNPKIRILKCDLSMRGKNLIQFSQSVIQHGGSMMAKRSSRIKDQLVRVPNLSFGSTIQLGNLIKDHPKTKKVQDGLEMVDI